MKLFTRLSERIRRNEPVPMFIGACLRGFSSVQRLGMWIRLHRPRTRVAARVISFGNLTAGGTGKTPAVIERACREYAAGERVAVLTRGYGAVRTRLPLVYDPNSGETAAPECFGDEAALIAASVPEVWVVRCPDRVAGGREALERGCTVLILDDGYQAVGLERDENILLIDATNPFGNGFLVPRGILREPVSALKRATEIIITRCDQAPEALPEIESVLRRQAPEIPVHYAVHQPVSFRRLQDGREFPPEFLKGVAAYVVCGIGNPESLARTLANLGITIRGMHALADHAAIPGTLLRKDCPVILTEKDAVRLGPVDCPDVYALAVSFAPYRPAASARASM
ncbi:MAG TPA: tetraacyldisaccharide 4'-kinase [Candidatus Hydrogenedentes bacterium]|nr:tetraacyldisaccharide 4'-kinase [Candidatus Hydrogenedentota bacterium]